MQIVGLLIAIALLVLLIGSAFMIWRESTRIEEKHSESETKPSEQSTPKKRERSRFETTSEDILMFSSPEEADEYMRKQKARIAADLAGYKPIKRKEREVTNVAEQKPEVERQDMPVVRKPSRFEGTPDEFIVFSSGEEAAKFGREQRARIDAQVAAYKAKKRKEQENKAEQQSEVQQNEPSAPEKYEKSPFFQEPGKTHHFSTAEEAFEWSRKRLVEIDALKAEQMKKRGKDDEQTSDDKPENSSE
jgi:hypothetical protein